MLRIAWMAFALLVAMLAAAPAAQAQKRVAFVVGTDKYDNLDKTRQLQRAANDARAVGAAFKALGFEVIAAVNLTRGQFNSEWQKFLDKLSAGDTAAIYYAGHGVEIEGLNFLLPRDIPDIKFGRQEQIKRESLSVAEILLDLRTRNPEIALVILDACRDNPLIPDEMRSAGARGGGLAPLKGEPPKGTFIMYSAGAGESALDRLPGNDPDPRNSIFTRKLLPLLATKGMALHDLARQLRADVLQLASTVPHQQRPAYYDGVIGKYCLAGCEDGPAKRAEALTIEDRVSAAARRWETLRNSTNLADLETFATLYNDTYFAGMAKARIDELKRTQTISKSYTFKQPGAEQKTAAIETPTPKPPSPTRSPKSLTADEERSLKPKDTFKECDDCPEMVVVPAGQFMMGSLPDEADHETDEGPQHKVTIAQPFAVGKFEVTFAQWDACVAEGGCTHNPDDKNWGRGKRPVINVSWYDITKEYLPRLSRKTGKIYRLLTEAEWEYAARGGTTTPFSTGRTITPEQANFDGRMTVEIGTFPANPFGLHDMHGNVWEWVQDCYKNSYAGAPVDGSTVTFGNCGWRIMRGGSWFNPGSLRSANRSWYTTVDRSNTIGFRVARTLNP